MMLGTSICSALFILGSSVIGMPVSGTTTIVSALLGAGLLAVLCYPENYGINWHEIGIIVLYWIISPLTSALISLIFFSSVCYFSLDGTRWSLAARIRWLTLICGVSVTFLTMLICLLTWPGRGKHPADGKTMFGSEWYDWVIILAMGLCGMLAARIFLVSKIDKPLNLCEKICIVTNFFSAEVFADEILAFKRPSKFRS